jgi:hypothetical protein
MNCRHNEKVDRDDKLAEHLRTSLGFGGESILRETGPSDWINFAELEDRLPS